MTIKNGGSAFPWTPQRGIHPYQCGMTLLDFFAAAAVPGLIVAAAIYDSQKAGSGEKMFGIAEQAFMMARNMLDESEKQK